MKKNRIFIILMDTQGRAYLCGPMRETSTFVTWWHLFALYWIIYQKCPVGSCAGRVLGGFHASKSSGSLSLLALQCWLLWEMKRRLLTHQIPPFLPTPPSTRPTVAHIKLTLSVRVHGYCGEILKTGLRVPTDFSVMLAAFPVNKWIRLCWIKSPNKC